MSKNAFLGEAVVNNLTQLKDVVETDLDDGTICWVRSLEDFFILNRNYSGSVDGITSVTGNTGTGAIVWSRMGISSIRWANQTAWFVNELTGSDENNGNTSSTPLKTISEFLRRIGLQPIKVAMTLTLLSDILVDSPKGSILVVVGGSFTMQGTPTQLATGAITSMTNLAKATNVAPLMTDTTVPSFSAYISPTTRGRTTSGTNSGSVFWFVKAPGANQARINPPIIPNTTVAVYTNTPKTLAVTDQYVVETLTKITTIGLTLSANDDGTLKPRIIFKDIDFVDICQFQTDAVNNEATIGFYACSMRCTRVIGASSMINCNFSTPYGDVFPGLDAGCVTDLYGGCCVGTDFIVYAGQINVDNSFMVQGGQFELRGCTGVIGDVGVFDSPVNGILVGVGMAAFFVGFLHSFAIWGSGNTAEGLTVSNGAIAKFFGSFTGATITGTAGDTKVVTTIATWAAVVAAGGSVISTATTFGALLK